jgi:hypothetical protein
MAAYYVNKNAQPNGDHEVHVSGCAHKPEPVSSKYLGDHSNCHDAVREAKKTYPRSNGCQYCCNECHTT